MIRKVITLLLVCLVGHCSGLGLVLCSNYHFYIEDKTNHVTMLEFGLGGITECRDFGTVNALQAFWLKMPHHCVTELNAVGMDAVMKFCPKILKDRFWSSIILDRLPKFDFKIMPGTHWCGAGNISNSKNDVGMLTKLDLCCKTHDHCPDYIAVGETKYGITNNKAGSISHCDCDDRFFQCLQDIRHIESDNVGFMFGNILAMPCFKKEHPIVKCTEYAGLMNNQCQHYQLDMTKPKIWQLFDGKVYYSSFLPCKLCRTV